MTCLPWSAFHFDTLPLYGWAVVGVLVFAVTSYLLLLFISAPYGRHFRPGWGPTISARAGWVCMELPSLLAFTWFFFTAPDWSAAPKLIVGLMFAVHYVHRSVIFPFRMRNTGKVSPWLTVGMAMVFNVANGGTIAYSVTRLAPHLESSAWLTTPTFWLGATLFTVGFVINRHADHVLISLRKPGETGYKIPFGGMYRWVSCPNYFGEIVEWVGFALAAMTLPAWAFAIFTAANLLPRARSNHKWYKEHFSDYPRERKVVVPLLY